MRIISQDGTIDVPYEQVVIQRYKEKIYFLNKNLTGIEQLTDDMEIASYSTEAKAQKAMEMLREYKETKEIRSIPLTKSLMESFSNVKMENFEIYTDGTGDYLKVDIVKKVEYFKFTADEDVEV